MHFLRSPLFLSVFYLLDLPLSDEPDECELAVLELPLLLLRLPDERTLAEDWRGEDDLETEPELWLREGAEEDDLAW